MQLVFLFTIFSTPCMCHLLYLMFRCDGDVMENLESLEILWELNTALGLFYSFSFVWYVLFVTGNANNETLFYMHVQPDRPDELERIEAAGGQIVNWHGPRVLGVLAMSRSIGTMMPPFVLCIWVIMWAKRTISSVYATSYSINCYNGSSFGKEK